MHILNTEEDIIYDTYPLYLSMKYKEIGIIRSATICYLMSKSGKVKTVEEIMKILG